MNKKGKNAFRAVLIVVVLIFAMCFALAACATGEDVQIEKVTSASEINRLIAKANFTAENAVRDKMEERYSALSDYSYNDGRATADIEKDGKSYSVTVEIEVDESDFSVTRYKNATRSGDSLIYTQNGEEVTYNVADKIVVEENGYFYVIDVSGARSEIDRAVSAAILTEKGGSQEENPGDIENPGTEEPENPDPENPDSQIETIDDINVIEQLLSQKDLTIEALAKAAATAFYGQGNVLNFSYQNGIVSGQAKTAEGTVNFSANLNLSATDFEGKFYAGAELSADGKTLSFYQNGTLATLTITEDMAVIETADGVNLLDTAAAEQMVANKFETTNNETSVPSQDITFDSWEELMNIENSAYYDDILEKMSEIVKREMVNTYFVQGVVGNISGRPATTLENTDTLRIGYNFNENGEIKEIIWTGVKYGHSSDTDAGIVYATVPMVTPISSDVVKVYTNSSENINNDSVVCGSNIIDLSGITGKIKYNEKSIKVQSRYGDRQLTEEKQQYFDLSMQLAVNADAIGENAKLAFVTVQGRSATNEKWGTTYNIAIKVFDIQTNELYSFTFIFDDDKQADNMIDRIKSAISREEFGVSGGEESALMSSSDIIFEFDALNNVAIYTIPQKESENQA